MRWKYVALKALAGIPFLASGCSLTQQAASRDQAIVAVQQDFQSVSSGKVVETMNSGGYTYVLIGDGDRQMWAAVPETEVSVGDEVALGYGVSLKNFTSRTLGRRFDDILFADGLKVAGEDETANAETEESAPAVHHQMASTSADGLTGKIVETMNSGGYTYICIEKDGTGTWAAVPTMKVDVGQDISLQPGMEMTSFTSKTLQRTFGRIIFSAGPAS